MSSAARKTKQTKTTLQDQIALGVKCDLQAVPSLALSPQGVPSQAVASHAEASQAVVSQAVPSQMVAAPEGAAHFERPQNSLLHSQLALAVLEEVPSGLLVVLPDGQLIVNSAAEKITGYLRSEVPTIDSWFDKVHGAEGGRFRSLYERDLASGSATLRVAPIMRKDGTIRHVEIVVARGQEDRALLSIQDVSDRVAAQERFRFVHEESRRMETRLRRTADALCEAQQLSLLGSFEIDVALGRREWSVQAATNFGLPDHVAMSTVDWLTFVAPEDVKRVSEQWSELMTGASEFNCEFRIHRGDGRAAVLIGRARTFSDSKGGVVRVVGTFQDVSHYRRLSNIIRQRDATLMRASRIATLADAVFSVSREMRDALDIVASSIENFALVLAQQSQSNSVEEILKRSQGVQLASVIAGSMIDKIDLISRIWGDAPLAECSLDSLLQDAARVYVRRFAEDGMTFDLPEVAPDGRPLECRSSDISQILLTLLDHAYLGIRERNGAGLAVSIQEYEDVWEVFVVEKVDGGAPSEDAPMLSSSDDPSKVGLLTAGPPAARAPGRVTDLRAPHSSGFKSHGLGLGLNVASSLAHAHGGAVRYAEGVQVGFVVRLPKRQVSGGIPKPA